MLHSRSHRRSPGLLRTAVFALAAVLLAGPGLVTAEDGDDEATPEGPHLEYRKSYELALLEARIRNLPVFVSRHKDY